MNRLDRLRSAESETWERYSNLGNQRWATDYPPAGLIAAHQETGWVWYQVNRALYLREKNIGAHADLYREVDEGEPRGRYNHTPGTRACIRICDTTYWYDEYMNDWIKSNRGQFQ